MYPPADELIEMAECRFTLVVQIAKRARQLVDGATPLVESEKVKAVSIAVQEIYEGKIKGERTRD